MASSKDTHKKRQKSRLKPSTSYFPKSSAIAAVVFVLLGAGVMLLSSSKFLVFPSGIDQSPGESDKEETANLIAKPTKLYIPRLSKTLYISDGEVVDNRWTISQTGVSYLVGSALPGSIGNSVIYGHNRNEILGYLPQVVAGDPIYVVLASGDFVKYQVFETKEVTPNQVDILNQATGDSRLTIYTCIGFLDQARFVVIAKKIERG